MRTCSIALLVSAVLAAVVVPPTTGGQQNVIVSKKNCTPDSCIKTLRQKGFPFSSAAQWCAAHNNGC